MKITKQRLQQIIQEEINSHKASQLNESIDVEDVRYVEELAQSLRNVYGAYVTGLQPDLKIPQTRARDGAPVTGENAHEEAKEMILDTIGEVIDTFERGETGLNEDGDVSEQ